MKGRKIGKEEKELKRRKMQRKWGEKKIKE